MVFKHGWAMQPVNFVGFFWPLCCPYDVVFKLFVGFVASNFMMCRSFDDNYACVACGEH
jgi:hypothetical protein